MKNGKFLMLRVALCACATVVSYPAQNAQGQNLDVPDKPFQAIHLINVKNADGEKTMSAAIADFNEAIAKGGCKKCAYHLWKAWSEESGARNYLWISSWPGRAAYVKVHESAEYQAASKKHAELGPIVEKQIYDRYVEVKTGK